MYLLAKDFCYTTLEGSSTTFQGGAPIAVGASSKLVRFSSVGSASPLRGRLYLATI